MRVTGPAFGTGHWLTELVASLLWVAVHHCPDDVWDALDPRMRQDAVMALRPTYPYHMAPVGPE